jgi:hypothetical protein
MKSLLKVNGALIADGIKIKVRNRSFTIKFPKKIWDQTPKGLKIVLKDNLVFANTHLLPLILDTTAIEYSTNYPLLESFFFRNQLYDLLFCESVDQVPRLSYLKQFYNLEYSFANNQSSLPSSNDFFKPGSEKKPVAILPFTSGKESLVTLGLCLELGIKPVLVFVQEPIQTYEEEPKKKILKWLKNRYHLDTYFVVNEPGLFREDRAFNLKPGTELGWGTQTTILALLMLPFVYASKARYLLFGNEFSNNEFSLIDGWKCFPSYDQSSFWTAQHNNIIILLTGDRTQLKSILEPLEEIQIFFLLHHRYPELGKKQFSCFGQHPLVSGSQWCHQCYKCARMYLFARALDLDPTHLGFKEDLLQKPQMFEQYFGQKVVTGSNIELDFAFWLVSKRGYPSPYVKQFRQEKLPYLKKWQWYQDHFTEIKRASNLPSEFQNKLLSIFKQEMKIFKKKISF